MPYEMRRKGEKYCVYNKDTGESKGCSDSRSMAVKHMRALYAAASGEVMGKEVGEEIDFNFSDDLGELIEVSDAELADEDSAVLSPSLLSKIKSFFAPKEEPILSDILVTKEVDAFGTARMRVTMPFTNNFEDRHGEIFASHAQKNFETFCDSNSFYPEFQLWHVDGSKWAQGDFIAYDDNGFGIVSGLVEPGLEHIAQSLAKSKEQIGVSHRAYALQKDNTVDAFWTWEVSPLPADKAANIWHNGIIAREADMPIDPTKRAWLVEHAGEEFVTKMEKDFETKAAELAAQGTKSKEEEQADPPENPEPAPVPTGLTLEAITDAFQKIVDPIIQDVATLKEKQKDIDSAAAALFAPNVPEGYVASEKNKSEKEPEKIGSWSEDSFQHAFAGGLK